MTTQDPIRKAMAVAYGVSFGIALAASLAFFAYATIHGGHDIPARYGGAVWVFVLALIIALPLTAPVLKRRFRGKA